jgi:RND family efflux transporter MFP subunit
MPDIPPYTRSDSQRSASGASVAYLDQALWRQLADAGTAQEFCAAWLGLLCRMVGDVSCAVVVLGPAESGPYAAVAVWPPDARDFARLCGVIDRVIAERKGIVTRSDAGQETEAPDEELRFHLAYPVWGDGRLHGAAALEIHPRPQVQLQYAMRQLQWGVPWVETWVLRKESAPEERVRQRLGLALDLTAVALQEERFQGAATAVATELATRLSCDRVSVGFVRGKQVRVRAISHSASVRGKMNLVRAIGEAMDEGVDQMATLVYPAADGQENRVMKAHEALAREHGDAAILTIPFVARDGKAFGAMTLERSEGEPFDEEAQGLADSVAALLGPVLEEKRRNDRLVVVKVGESVWRQARKVFGPRHVAVKLVVAALAGLVAVFVFAKGDYRVTANTVLKGEIQRVITAPYPGYISAAKVRAGDVVKVGQVMCTLDDRDMSLERLKWSSQREQHQLEYRKALAKGEMGTAKALQEQIRQAEAQLDLLDKQLSRASIVAPFDGIVVTGDLSQSLGAPVERGQVLFEVAPLDDYRVVLEVDERDVNEVRPGQKGTLILNAFPEEKMPFQVAKVTPVSVAREGRNYFNIEARLDRLTQRLRPGLEGTSKVEVGRRNLFWIYGHDLIDWVRLWVWSWWP